MLASLTDALVAVREIVFDNVPEGTRFAFDFDEADDIGSLQAGPLFSQNGDFFLFEVAIDDVRRAGPSQASPDRSYGVIALSLYTKDSSKGITHRRLLEATSRWFADKTVRNIRFRTFIPTREARMMGFTSYSGVINFEFEIMR